MMTTATLDDTVAPDSEQPCETTPKITVVIAVVLTGILEILDTTIVNVALPQIKAAFGATSDQITWILTAYIVASLMMMPLTGLLAGAIGRRRLVVGSIVGFATFSALCGISSDLNIMVICRIGQGLFGAFLIPLSQSILFDSFPAEKRGTAMAIFGVGMICAPVMGPTLGALLTEYFSWRAVFYINIPVATFALFLIMGELKRDDTKKVHIDWFGLFLMAIAIGSLQMMLDKGVEDGWFQSHFIQICAFFALFFGAYFFWRGWNYKGNVIDLSLFKDRTFASSSLILLGFGFGMYGVIAILPIYVQGVLGYPILDTGLLFVPRGLSAAVAMVLCGTFLMRHLDLRILIALGLIFTGVGNILMSNIVGPASFWDISWPGMVSGFGMGLFFVPLSVLAFKNIAPETMDNATGLFGVMRSLGSSIGIALASWQVSARGQFHDGHVSASVTEYDASVPAYLSKLNMSPHSADGISQIEMQIHMQAEMLAFQDVFLLAGWSSLICLPLIFFADGGKGG